MPSHVIKRSGSVVNYDRMKITKAIHNAILSTLNQLIILKPYNKAYSDTLLFRGSQCLLT